MRITKQFRFEAAHWLPRVEAGHQCGRMHGHTYHIELGVEGEVDPLLGWFIDYADIKKAWKPLEDQFDHHTLNDTIDNPTAENIAVYVFDQLEPLIPGLADVTVRETESSSAVYRPSDDSAMGRLLSGYESAS